MNEQSNKSAVIGIIVATLVVFGGLTWLVARSPSDQNRVEQLTFVDANAPFVGPEGAPVVVRVYGDFQCPACRAAEPALKSAIVKFADRVKFVWKDFPLETIHKNARLAANAARCAQDQQKFMSYHDFLYQTQSDWSELADPSSKFVEYAGQTGMHAETFAACLASRSNNAKVSADVSEGLQNNVNSTPTFFVNNTRYQGLSAADWDRILTQALQKAASPATVSSTTP